VCKRCFKSQQAPISTIFEAENLLKPVEKRKRWTKTNNSFNILYNNFIINSFLIINFKMSEIEECDSLQTEETEVLTSIYEGDSCFSCEPDKKLYQYKYGQVSF